MENPSQSYLQETAEHFGLPEEDFYYVSTESSKDFLEALQPSVIAYVKNKKSTSIDLIQVSDGNGGFVPYNSCSEKEGHLTKEIIENHLNEEKTYNGLVIKSIKDQKTFKFPKDQLVAVTLYSKKIKDHISPYANLLKLMASDENIPNVIISMDLEDLEEIPDVFQNSVFD